MRICCSVFAPFFLLSPSFILQCAIDRSVWKKLTASKNLSCAFESSLANKKLSWHCRLELRSFYDIAHFFQWPFIWGVSSQRHFVLCTSIPFFPFSLVHLFASYVSVQFAVSMKSKYATIKSGIQLVYYVSTGVFLILRLVCIWNEFFVARGAQKLTHTWIHANWKHCVLEIYHFVNGSWNNKIN